MQNKTIDNPNISIIAKQISEYLTLGMHHSTFEAQTEITKIIEKSYKTYEQSNIKH